MNNNVDDVERRPSPISGQGLFVKRNFGRGAILASIERPLITTLPWGVDQACAWCFVYIEDDSWALHPRNLSVPPRLALCSGCSDARYCGEECKNAHWEAVHKHECKALAEHAPVQNTIRIAMQILLGLERQDPAFAALMEGESNFDKIRADGGWQWQGITDAAKAAYEYAGRPSRVSLTTAKKAACLARNTAIYIQTLHKDLIGTALDPLMSSMNHSCDPNAVLIWDGPKLILRALRPIDRDQQVRVSYIDLNRTSDNDVFDWRQANLQDRFGFKCSCSKCSLRRQGAADAWSKNPQQISDQAKTAMDALWPDLRKLQESMAEPLPLRPASDGDYDQRAAALEILGYHELQITSHGATNDEMKARIPKVIALLENSGLFGPGRAPIPSLYNMLWKACYRLQSAFDQCLLISMKLHFVIDPVLYPQPCHPTRVFHSFYLMVLSQAILEQHRSGAASYPILRALEDRGIPVNTMHSGLLFEMRQKVPRSFGKDSQIMKVVNDKWQWLMHTPQMTGQGQEQWLERLREDTSRVLAKAGEVAQQMFMLPDGLHLPPGGTRTSGSSGPALSRAELGDDWPQKAARVQAEKLASDLARLGPQPGDDDSENEDAWEDVIGGVLERLEVL